MGIGVLWLAVRSPELVRRHRIRTVVFAGVAAGLLAGGYAGLVTLVRGFSSLTSMTDTFNEEATQIAFLTQERLLFYPVWMVRSVVSPALTLALLPLGVFWAARSRVGLGLVLVTVLGQLGWLVATVPILDERFVLTLVPAGLLAAALGFAALSHAARIVAAPLVLVVGLSVSWDMHFGAPGVFQIADPAWRVDHWRKLGMESAYNIDGAWARGDVDGLDCADLRKRLWDAVVSCEATVVGIGEREAPLLREGYWWSFKSVEMAVRTGGTSEFHLVNTWDETGAELVFTAGAVPEGEAVVRIGDLDCSDCPEIKRIAVWAPSPRDVCW